MIPIEDLPLFSLSTVLFPGDPLSLRIFEPRYLNRDRPRRRAARRRSGLR
jgi:hypothetical protein